MILSFSQLGLFEIPSPLTWSATKYLGTVLEIGYGLKNQFAQAIQIMEENDIIVDYYHFPNEYELIKYCKSTKEPRFRPQLSLHNVNSPRQAAWYTNHFCALCHLSYNVRYFSPQDFKYQLRTRLPPLLHPKKAPSIMVAGLHRVALMPHILKKIVDNLHERPQGDTLFDKIQARIQSRKNLVNLEKSSELLRLKIRLL